MNKVKIRILGSLTIILCLCLPKMIFMVEDYHDFQKLISIDDGQIQTLMKKHPLISQLYNYNYSFEDFQAEEYVIKNIDSYSSSKQETIKNIQSLYNEEIQKLIDKNILSSSLLEMNTKSYQTTFGTISIESDQKNERYILNQTYRIHTNHDKAMTFVMDKETQKIMSVSISLDKTETFHQDIKETLWSMIEYLELDDIEDWNYNQDGYESFQTKLRVSYQKTTYDDMQEYCISIQCLYSSSATLLFTY